MKKTSDFSRFAQLFRLSYPFVACFLLIQIAQAQVELTVSTDKTVYDYGEAIEINVTISNNTASPFTLTGSSSCQAKFRFDEFDASQWPCTADFIEIKFNPGAWRGWTWTLDPAEIGLPSRDGDHTIIGFYPGTALADTITVSAPAFLGGKLSVSINAGVSDDQLSSLFDSLNVSVLFSRQVQNRRTEVWQISGMSVDDAVMRWGADTRFYFFDAYRIPLSWTLTDLEDEPTTVAASPVLEVYPNPCQSNCRLRLTSGGNESISISIYDLLGRLVARESLPRGVNPLSPHEISLKVSTLKSGIYFISVRQGDKVSNSMFVKVE